MTAFDGMDNEIPKEKQTRPLVSDPLVSDRIRTESRNEAVRNAAFTQAEKGQS